MCRLSMQVLSLFIQIKVFACSLHLSSVFWSSSFLILVRQVLAGIGKDEIIEQRNSAARVKFFF